MNIIIFVPIYSVLKNAFAKTKPERTPIAIRRIQVLFIDLLPPPYCIPEAAVLNNIKVNNITTNM